MGSGFGREDSPVARRGGRLRRQLPVRRPFLAKVWIVWGVLLTAWLPVIGRWMRRTLAVGPRPPLERVEMESRNVLPSQAP